uniref:Uncharacterized protein n=1 Tax=Anguilla anguilla TaxID=7936 RepID=A0A0E9PMB7_ANGAN
MRSRVIYNIINVKNLATI